MKRNASTPLQLIVSILRTFAIFERSLFCILFTNFYCNFYARRFLTRSRHTLQRHVRGAHSKSWKKKFRRTVQHRVKDVMLKSSTQHYFLDSLRRASNDELDQLYAQPCCACLLLRNLEQLSKTIIMLLLHIDTPIDMTTVRRWVRAMSTPTRAFLLPLAVQFKGDDFIAEYSRGSGAFESARRIRQWQIDFTSRYVSSCHAAQYAGRHSLCKRTEGLSLDVGLLRDSCIRISRPVLVSKSIKRHEKIEPIYTHTQRSSGTQCCNFWPCVIERMKRRSVQRHAMCSSSPISSRSELAARQGTPMTICCTKSHLTDSNFCCWIGGNRCDARSLFIHGRSDHFLSTVVAIPDCASRLLGIA